MNKHKLVNILTKLINKIYKEQYYDKRCIDCINKEQYY